MRQKIVDISFASASTYPPIKSWMLVLKFEKGDKLEIYLNSEMDAKNLLWTFTELIRELSNRFL